MLAEMSMGDTDGGGGEGGEVLMWMLLLLSGSIFFFFFFSSSSYTLEWVHHLQSAVGDGGTADIQTTRKHESDIWILLLSVNLQCDRGGDASSDGREVPRVVGDKEKQ